jgi:hypothetical protein
MVIGGSQRPKAPSEATVEALLKLSEQLGA